MTLSCPHCKCDDIQSLPGIFESAQSESLVRLAAPPRKGSCLLIMEFWFLATMIMDLTAKMLHWPQFVGGLVLLSLFMVSVFAVLAAWSYNRFHWPALYHKWQQSYLCMRCSRVFERE